MLVVFGVTVKRNVYFTNTFCPVTPVLEAINKELTRTNLPTINLEDLVEFLEAKLLEALVQKGT